VIIYADMPSYLKLLTGQITPEEAIAKGLIRIEGGPLEAGQFEDKLEALSRFLKICCVPKDRSESIRSDPAKSVP